jgi:hypothetical protein
MKGPRSEALVTAKKVDTENRAFSAKYHSLQLLRSEA